MSPIFVSRGGTFSHSNYLFMCDGLLESDERDQLVCKWAFLFVGCWDGDDEVGGLSD
jgi:hypothetical protein